MIRLSWWFAHLEQEGLSLIYAVPLKNQSSVTAGENGQDEIHTFILSVYVVSAYTNK